MTGRANPVESKRQCDGGFTGFVHEFCGDFNSIGSNDPRVERRGGLDLYFLTWRSLPISQARQGRAAPAGRDLWSVTVAKKTDDLSSKPKASPRGSAKKPSKAANSQAAGGKVTENNKRTGNAAATRKAAMSSDVIGEAAGDVWRVLSERGGQTVAGLKKAIDGPEEVILAAIGWLAREDKLTFATNGRSVTVSLT